jgi:hypothetical protein
MIRGRGLGASLALLALLARAEDGCFQSLSVAGYWYPGVPTRITESFCLGDKSSGTSATATELVTALGSEPVRRRRLNAKELKESLAAIRLTMTELRQENQRGSTAAACPRPALLWVQASGSERESFTLCPGTRRFVIAKKLYFLASTLAFEE